MRSLDSELSTNERPRFWPDSWHVPNFDPSNAPPIGFFSMAASVEFHSSANGMPIKCQRNNHWLPIACELNENWMPIDFELKTNWLSIECHWAVSWVSIQCKLTVNWMPFLVNWMRIDCQSNANSCNWMQNWLQIEYRLTVMKIQCKLTANWVSIEYNFISRPAPRLFPFIKGNDRGADPEMNSLITDHANGHPISQLSVIWPILCQLNQSIANPYKSHFMGTCLYSIGFISRKAPRSFPFIKGNARGADLEMN